MSDLLSRDVLVINQKAKRLMMLASAAGVDLALKQDER
jgi:hypothetical protein